MCLNQQAVHFPKNVCNKCYNGHTDENRDHETEEMCTRERTRKSVPQCHSEQNTQADLENEYDLGGFVTFCPPSPSVSRDLAGRMPPSPVFVWPRG